MYENGGQAGLDRRLNEERLEAAKSEDRGDGMATHVLARRAALVAFGVWAVAGLSACNTAPTPSVQSTASGFRIGSIQVNTAPLVAQSGNPTASWAQQALPGQLAQSFAPVMAPGDPSGATLNVRIDSIYLGEGGAGDPDRIRGAATLSGGGAPTRTARVRTIAVYIPSPVDQSLPEQALQGRVQALSQSFAYSLAKKLRL
jgi:hypothetical protein